jgi:hypothetical protein
MTKIFAVTEIFTNVATVIMLAVIPAATFGFLALSI